MSDYVLFQMWKPFRKSLIKRHHFYVEQARKRLLSQFEDIEADANKAAKVWLEQNHARFDPDHHNPEDFYEAANDAGIEFYELLSDMREQTRLNITAGMFHEWDKQLRDWLVREIEHWHSGDNTRLKVWSADFNQIADLLESFGWKIRATTYFRALDACRLVVNVYKHGEGKSLTDLRQNYPEYLDDPLKGTGSVFTGPKYPDHTNLKVSEKQFQGFSDAIVAFWQDVPEDVFESQIKTVPDWFGKAILKDQNGQRHANKK
ncbi:hypothetical protein [Oricola thermophila]|uniref:Uncharacterized protein n=1 Tax=Oricola thermophila TaxID=2742145 RepID=A0A6N1VC30_9HYPH|nr:hypothetical protein [Oricola thermophila]QKV17075.1 hypothetical protein HTY61_00630 [Oricola thermophila]